MTAQLDGALDVLASQREQLMAEDPSVARASQLARVYELEARLRQTLFEHARTRVQWRAALAAEAYARLCARHWRRRAENTQQQLPTGFLLVCDSCQGTYEPTGEDVGAGRSGCPDPDCGGWTLWAQLAEPTTGRGSRKAG
ncbi:MAG: hypothetical protein GEV09_04635 [Pseudonocardiaceae bacterium]|nr:hypothetical protein [Pseudonocardiaceae bacterium]